jgi:hypothetical protein
MGQEAIQRKEVSPRLTKSCIVAFPANASGQRSIFLMI